MNTYYQNKLHILESIFGTTDITLHPDSLRIRDVEYPIVRDAIILLASQEGRFTLVRVALSTIAQYGTRDP